MSTTTSLDDRHPDHVDVDVWCADGHDRALVTVTGDVGECPVCGALYALDLSVTEVVRE